MAGARLTAAAIAASLAVCWGCGGTTASPTSPSSASVVRLWTGAFEIQSCTGTSSQCRLAPEKFALRLGSDSAGVLQIDTGVWTDAPAIPVAVGVAGTATTGGVTLSGSTAIGRDMQVELALTRLDPTLDGTVRYTVQGIDGPVAKSGRILYAVLDDTIQFGRLQGSWRGLVARTECTGDCAALDPVLPRGAVSLDLSQNGAALSGRLNGHEVTGMAAGSAFTAAMHKEVAAGACRPAFDDGAVCLLDVSIDAAADTLDRLRGTLTYRVEAVDYLGRHYAFSARADLAGVTRWP